MHTSSASPLINPLPLTWRAFAVRYCALWGVILLGAGVICFIAWNWKGLSPISQLTLIGSGMVLGWLAALRCGLDRLPGKLALLWAAILIGPLFAVYGQAYQTGAPLWRLFALWAACTVPLAFAGRQAALWALAWGVGATAVFTWLGFNSAPLPWVPNPPSSKLLIATACLILPLLLWETARALLLPRGEAFAFLAPLWLSRLMVLLPLYLLTYLVISKIFANDYGHAYKQTSYLGIITFAMYALFTGGLWFWCQRHIKDLCILGLILCSFCALILAVIAKAMPFEAGSFLVIGFCVIGLLFGATKILLLLKKQMSATGPEATPDLSATGDPYPLNETLTPDESPFENATAPSSSGCADYCPLSDESSEDMRNLPWYVTVMQTLAAWVASLSFLVFLGWQLFENRAMIPGGVVLVILAAIMQRKTKEYTFASHFTLPLALAGSITLWVGLLDIFGHVPASNFYYPLLLAFLFLTVPHKTFRICLVSIGGLIAWFLIRMALMESFDSYTADPSMYLVRFLAWGLPIIIFGLAILSGVWFTLNKDMCSAKQLKWLNPLLQGLALFLTLGLCLGLAIRSSEKTYWVGQEFLTAFNPHNFGWPASCGLLFAALLLSSPQKPTWRAALAMAAISALGLLRWLHLGFAVAAVLLALALVFFNSRRAGQDICPQNWRSTLSRMGIVALVAAAGLAAFWMPALPLAVLGVVLAQAQKQRLLAGATAFFLAISLWQFYYALDTSLLNKSLLLLASGGTLLLLALALQGLRFKLPAHQSGKVKTHSVFRRLAPLLVSSLLIWGVFGGVLVSATIQERQIYTAERFLLLLAPRDPRALLMGDYMELRKQIENNLEVEIKNTLLDSENTTLPSQVILQFLPGEGDLPIAVLARLDNGEKLASDERRVNYSLQDGHARIGASRFYFTEGAGDELERKAQFGVFGLGPNGKLWLLGLADENGELLEPTKFLPTSD